MIAFEHNLLFKLSIGHLIHFNQNVFSDRFDREQFFGRLKLHQEDLAEGTSAKDHELLEIVKFDLFLIFLL